MQQEIQAYVVTKSATIAKIDSINFFFTDGKYATARVLLLDIDGVIIKTMNVHLTKEQLDVWGEDDSILMDIVLSSAELQSA